MEIPDAVRRAIYPLEYEGTIREAAGNYGLEPTFVAGVVYTESRFRPRAQSHRSAYGLMQLMPETARFVQDRSGIRGDWRDPQVNLRLGAWYLGYLKQRFSGDERLMLAAYNSGEAQVNAWTADRDFDIGRDIPFEETRQYVENVLEAQRRYEDIYGKNLRRNAE